MSAIVRQYRAMANQAAMVRLVTRMPTETFADVCRAARARGESVQAYVGRVAFTADRGQDVELVTDGGK